MVTTVLDSRRESLKVMETEEFFNLQINSLFAGTMDRMNEYDVVIEDIEPRFSGDEIKVQKQQEGKDVRVVVRIQQLQSEDNQQKIKGKLEEETMLSKNIVKDHHSIMMIGIMEITMEDVEAVKKEEEEPNSHQRINEWEEELELLKKWLKAPVEKKKLDEDCKGSATEEEKEVPQGNELDIEIELMMELMRKSVSKGEYNNKKEKKQQEKYNSRL